MLSTVERVFAFDVKPSTVEFAFYYSTLVTDTYSWSINEEVSMFNFPLDYLRRTSARSLKVSQQHSPHLQSFAAKYQIDICAFTIPG